MDTEKCHIQEAGDTFPNTHHFWYLPKKSWDLETGGLEILEP